MRQESSLMVINRTVSGFVMVSGINVFVANINFSRPKILSEHLAFSAALANAAECGGQQVSRFRDGKAL